MRLAIQATKIHLCIIQDCTTMQVAESFARHTENSCRIDTVNQWAKSKTQLRKTEKKHR